MPGQTLIYGATGYTGQLIVEEARKLGLRPVLAGRDRHRLAALAGSTGLPTRCFGLDDPSAVFAGLEGVSCVLNAAGPFSATWRPVVDACVATGTHYADITGEIDVFEGLAARDAEATEASIALVPGVGFDVVPSDCLLAFVAGQVGKAARLRLVIAGTPAISRGTARTVAEAAGRGTAVRRGGRIEWLDMPPQAEVTLNGVATPVVGISYGDVSTAWRSTGAPDIAAFVTRSRSRGLAARLAFGTRHARWLRLIRPLIERSLDLMPAGPTAGEGSGPLLVGEAWGEDGRHATAQMVTPEVYRLTARMAAEALLRLSRDEVAPGFHTPVTAFGMDYATGFSGVERIASPTPSASGGTA